MYEYCKSRSVQYNQCGKLIVATITKINIETIYQVYCNVELIMECMYMV